MDMCRARVTSANDGGRAVRTREVRIDKGGDVESLAEDAVSGPLGGTSAKYICAEDVAACMCRRWKLRALLDGGLA